MKKGGEKRPPPPFFIVCYLYVIIYTKDINNYTYTYFIDMYMYSINRVRFLSIYIINRRNQF